MEIFEEIICACGKPIDECICTCPYCGERVLCMCCIGYDRAVGGG